MPSLAILMTGTVRETVFLSRLLPHIVGNCDYDLYLALRQTRPGSPGSTSRLGKPEPSVDATTFPALFADNVSFCLLPPDDRDHLRRTHVIPTGPTSPETEIQCVSMFKGIFAGVGLIRNSGRPYEYIVRTRTDYLFWDAPLFERCREVHGTEGKIIVDPQRTGPYRYGDNPHLPWQGSISDLFSFSTAEQFFRMWDFEESLARIWTGIPETTLFRNALHAFAGEIVQHPRKNEAFLARHFHIIEGDYGESPYYFRRGTLTRTVQDALLSAVEEAKLPPRRNLDLVWSAYRYARNPDGALQATLRQSLAEFGVRDPEHVTAELAGGALTTNR